MREAERILRVESVIFWSMYWVSFSFSGCPFPLRRIAFDLLLSGRESHDEATPFRPRRIENHVASMGLCDLAGDGEPEAGAWHVVGSLAYASIKGLEDAHAFGFGDAGPFVAHGGLDCVAV